MKQVLIVSKTHMNNQVCVGGIVMADGTPVRLLDNNGHNQPQNTPLEIGSIWDIDFTQRFKITPPHVEDVIINKMKPGNPLPGNTRLSDILQKQLHVPIWYGAPDKLFDGLLQWTRNGSGFINGSGICETSSGFWISDKALVRDDFKGIRYKYGFGFFKARKIKYVGFQEPADKIPAGSLLRVSLARWWKQDDDTEERCFLQLSGWY